MDERCSYSESAPYYSGPALYLQRLPAVAVESSRVATVALNTSQPFHHQVGQPTLQAQIPRSCAGLGHSATTKSAGLP